MGIIKHFFANNAITKDVWRKGKQRIILNKQHKIARFWHPIINEYFEGKIEQHQFRQKIKLPNKKVIWQYWGQGEDSNMPDLVKLCFDSVDRHCQDFEVIRLDDQTLHNYLDLPEYLWKGDGEPKFPRVFFSDLLRLALLSTYGGIWIDATILLTGPLPENYISMDYFVFQREDEIAEFSEWPSTDLKFWSWDKRFKVRMLTSIFFAKSQNQLVNTLMDLILYYWKTQHRIRHYFILQILYNELVVGQLKNLKCPTVPDAYPHLLRMLVDGHDDIIGIDEMLQKTTIHKLTYFKTVKMQRFRQILEEINQILYRKNV